MQGAPSDFTSNSGPKPPGVFALSLTALACAFVLAGCDALRPFEQTCERKLETASFHVIAAPTQHELDLSQSAAQLGARGAAAAGRLILGITSAQMKSRVSATGNALTAPFSRRYCVRPQVEVTLAVEPLTVAIAREHAPGSCEHGLTLGHEMKHVLVYERFLLEVAVQVEAELKAKVGDQVRYFASRAEGERELPLLVERAVNPLIEAVMRQVQQRQAAIDTPEEYMRLDLQQARCLR